MFAFSKNNSHLCSCISYRTISSGARSLRYRHRNSLAQVRRIRKVRQHVPKARCGMQGLGFFVPIQLCIPLKKPATYCQRSAPMWTPSLKPYPISSWPMRPSPSRRPSWIHSLLSQKTNGQSGWRIFIPRLSMTTMLPAAPCAALSLHPLTLAPHLCHDPE